MARKLLGKIFTKDFNIDDDYIDVWPMGDLHLGHKKFNEKEFKRYIAWVLAKSNRYIFGIGDYIECATSAKNPGKALTTQILSAGKQIEKFLDLVKPINDRFIAITEGNHEHRVYGSGSEIDITETAIAPRIGTHYLGYQDWVRLRFNKKVSYYNYLKHGPKGRGSTNPKFHLDREVEKLGYGNQADVVMMGHNHIIYKHPYLFIKFSGPYKYLHRCWGIRTGGFLDNPKYASDAGYRPAEVGSPIIRYYTKKKKIIVFFDLDEYEELTGNDEDEIT